MTAIWKPDTCACVADPNNRVLIRRCNTHNTFTELQTHNNQAKFAELDDEVHLKAREDERKKVEYQTRVLDRNITTYRGMKI